MSAGLSAATMSVLESAKERLSTFGADASLAPKELEGLLATVSSALASGSGVRAATYLWILLLIGCGVEWLYWSYAWGPLRAIESATVASRRQALGLGMRRLTLLGSGLLLFSLAILGASAGFRWPAGVQEGIVTAALLVVAVRLGWVMANVLLAPGLTRLRLLPVTQAEARWLAAVVVVLSALVPLGTLVPAFLEQVAGAPHSANLLRLVVAGAIALLLTASAFALTGGAEPKVPRRSRLPRFPRAIVISIMVFAVFAVWLLGSVTGALIAAVVVAVVVLQMVLREIVFYFWGDVAAPAAPSLMPSIVLSVSRFAIVLFGLGACALALDSPVSELAASQHFAVRFGLQLLGVAALALFANVVWILVKTTIDHRLEGLGPLEAHAATNPHARLLTLLPLLRTTAAVMLAVMLVLSSLWALGIEITPLLAGAGVVGLALGFGAQALVRDVIAGIFFLAEDVFRVGEYVESGTTTKGTVEKITLRTVALRHHNGPLHFVPYGSLGTVRNNSRDWVIEKFNLPLPVEVDSEKIRKVIKKIGQQMLEDPDIGHMLREPLKSKLARIDPGVKVFRCKFQTAPGNQFDVRAQAFKRIEAELRALGIPFAGGAQTIILERG